MYDFKSLVQRVASGLQAAKVQAPAPKQRDIPAVKLTQPLIYKKLDRIARYQ